MFMKLPFFISCQKPAYRLSRYLVLMVYCRPFCPER